jgi:hypothetical protein
MSFYLIVFQGGNAVGSAVMGITAQRIGLSLTLLAAAAGLALGPIAGLRYRFQAIPPQELLPAGDWPQPHLAAGHAPAGPVMVTVEYRPRDGLHDDLLAALEDARFQSAPHRSQRLARLAGGGRPGPDRRTVRSRLLGRTPPPAPARHCPRPATARQDPRHDRPRLPSDGHTLADARNAVII